MSGLSGVLKGLGTTFKDGKSWAKIRDNLETAAAGSRAWPTDRRRDAKVGVRIDYGQRFEENGTMYMNLCLQANKNAENATIRAKAAKDSHANLGVLAVSVPTELDEHEFWEKLQRSAGVFEKEVRD